MDMKRFILMALLLALASGPAWASVRLDLDAGVLSGPVDALNAITIEGQTSSEASALLLGETSTAIETPPLTALVVASHDSATTLETVTFDASGSLPGDGSFTLYEWDLDGDGDFDASSSSDTWDHVYVESGVVFVQVRVTNDLGESTLSDALQLDVVNRLPTAQFDVNLGGGVEGDVIQFLNLSNDLDGTISSWLWNFGDGATSNEASPTHIYDTAGLFSVALSVTDDNGDTSDAYVFEIEILNLEPVAEFSPQQSTTSVEQLLIFVDESVDLSANGEIVHVAWDFGDGAYQAGGPSSDNVYSHVFTTPGMYTVTLYVIDNDGAMAQAQSTIEVL